MKLYYGNIFSVGLMLFASSGDLIFMNTTASPAAATQPNSNNNNAVNDVILQVAETIGLERRDIQELGSFANADAEIEDFVSGLERRSPQAVGRKKKKKRVTFRKCTQAAFRQGRCVIRPGRPKGKKKRT